jgi:hypothetical protein
MEVKETPKIMSALFQGGWKKRPYPILYNHWMGKEAWYQNSFLPDEAEVFTAPTPQRRYRSQPEGARLMEAISPYIDLPKLRRLAAQARS